MVDGGPLLLLIDKQRNDTRKHVDNVSTVEECKDENVHLVHGVYVFMHVYLEYCNIHLWGKNSFNSNLFYFSVCQSIIIFIVGDKYGFKCV